MSERTMVSRRGILTLAGGSVIGATAISAASAAVEGLTNQTDFGSVLVTTMQRYVVPGTQMIIVATIQVDPQFVGAEYNLRVAMHEDTGEQRSEHQTDTKTIPSASFTVQINKGDNLAGNDWNLDEDRCYIMTSSFNIRNRSAFSLSPAYAFKVMAD